MNNSGDTVNFTAMILTIAGFGALLLVYVLIYKRLKVFAQRTANQWDDIMLDLFKIPLFWVLVWIMLKFFTYAFLKELSVFKYVTHINNILLILSVTWVLMKSMKLLVFLLQKKNQC